MIVRSKSMFGFEKSLISIEMRPLTSFFETLSPFDATSTSSLLIKFCHPFGVIYCLEESCKKAEAVCGSTLYLSAVLVSFLVMLLVCRRE